MSDAPSKSYSPAEHEARIQQRWLDAGAFCADPDERPPERRFVMVIPPPNVTGALHLGHALNNTLQDILVRQHRMAGFNTLWIPGTDHAGIATQAVVEKEILRTERKSRHDLGREELVRRIWEWKEQYGGRILEQLQRMGCSCDWRRTRFTLDDLCARAVRQTFFNLFRDGLIYRGKRLVNWDTQLQTAVADDEVYHETVRGHLWYVRYPLPDGRGSEKTNPLFDRRGADQAGRGGDIGYLVIATTRPETMLGDTAVAVHPEDDRFASLVGRKVLLPLTGREIPIIADGLLVKREFGTGCVKVTPAHDPNDYQCALRHDLPMINIMTPDGRVNENGGPYAGLKLDEARKKIVADLEAAGLIEKIEDYETDVGHSDRSKVPIQPYLSDQWFVKMGDLTPEEAARVQSPFFRAYLDRGKSEPRPALSEPPPALTEPRPSGSGFSSRAKVPGLAQMAIEAVREGRVRFFPERYAKTYLDWLSEKRDWCISRQLWWGHRVPVWSAPGADENPDAINEGDTQPETRGEWFIQDRPVVAQPRREDGRLVNYLCLPDGYDDIARYIETEANPRYVRDPDVLDTWFSSALWPHSTLGWPGADPHKPPLNKGGRGGVSGAGAAGSDLAYFYPTTTLSTAREIITLWVARMVLTGLYNVGEVPFRDVVIHAVIQDGQGRRMSKSLGNGVDPLDIIDAYGTDALRFTLADLATETQDIRIPVKPMKLPDSRTVNTSERFEKGRNFCNKLWQVSTGYVLPNLNGFAQRPLADADLALEDRWVLSRLAAAQVSAEAALADYRFSDAIQALYQFMWNDYCDWYVEMSKPRLRAAGRSADAARQVLVWCLDRLLRLLHPVTPFITEALWERLNAAAPRRGLTRIEPGEPLLATAAWPAPEPQRRDAEVEADVEILKAVVRAVRDARTRVNALRSGQPALRTLPRAVVRGNARCCGLLATHGELVRTLAGCDVLEFDPSAEKPPGSITHVHEAAQVFVPVGGLANLSAERERLERALADKQAAYQREADRLASEAFRSRAAPDTIARTQERADELRRQIDLVRQHLADLD